MNSELAALAARLTAEYEAAEKAHRTAQAKLREVREEIAKVRSAAKLLNEPDPFAEALKARRRELLADVQRMPAHGRRCSTLSRPRRPRKASTRMGGRAEIERRNCAKGRMA